MSDVKRRIRFFKVSIEFLFVTRSRSDATNHQRSRGLETNETTSTDLRGTKDCSARTRRNNIELYFLFRFFIFVLIIQRGRDSFAKLISCSHSPYLRSRNISWRSCRDTQREFQPRQRRYTHRCEPKATANLNEDELQIDGRQDSTHFGGRLAMVVWANFCSLVPKQRLDQQRRRRSFDSNLVSRCS